MTTEFNAFVQISAVGSSISSSQNGKSLNILVESAEPSNGLNGKQESIVNRAKIQAFKTPTNSPLAAIVSVMPATADHINPIMGGFAGAKNINDRVLTNAQVAFANKPNFQDRGKETFESSTSFITCSDNATDPLLTKLSSPCTGSKFAEPQYIYRIAYRKNRIQI